jgi:hypothetical protein
MNYEDSTNVVVVGSGNASNSIKPEPRSSDPMKKLKLQTAVVMAMSDMVLISDDIKMPDYLKDIKKRKGKGKHRNRYGTNPAYPS